jgi:predicted Zn finger-like uncharacterized protein
MTESFVTQCPHCRTSFKVSHNQLSVARGAVRCGACKQVFNAARQLLEQSTGPAIPGTVQAKGEGPAVLPSAQAPRPLSQVEWQAGHADLDQLDPLDLDQLDLDQELARLERRPASPAARGNAPSTLSAQRNPAEDWPDEPFGSYQDEGDDATADEPTGSARQEPRLSAEGPLKVQADAGDIDDEPPKGRRQGATPPARLARSEPELREEHLLTLQDDPLKLEWEKPPSSLGKRLLWTALALVAAVALLAQYVVFHFDELARQDAYRPWFVALCPGLGCSVPSRVDIQLIRSSNLVVRSHPTFAGALVVDAIIYNRAPFSQPFPLLELRFADINNKLIASRRFKPSEYLSGDLAGQSEMPPQVPIHIALDILDPGKRAVNYSLSFHSPE